MHVQDTQALSEADLWLLMMCMVRHNSGVCASSLRLFLKQFCGFMQEVASKSRMVEDVVAALRNEEAAKLAAQHDAQAARTRIHQLEVHFPPCLYQQCCVLVVPLHGY